MSWRARLKRAERVTSTAGAGATSKETQESARAKHDERCDAWQAAFARGEVLPAFGPAKKWAALRHSLASWACLYARVERRIGAVNYLPNMSDAERRYVDSFCGSLFEVNRTLKEAGLPHDDPDPWPAWTKYLDPNWTPPAGDELVEVAARDFDFNNPPDLRAMSDAELKVYSAEVEAIADGHDRLGARLDALDAAKGA